MTVSIWADTGEVSIMGPTVTDSTFADSSDKQSDISENSIALSLPMVMVLAIICIVVASLLYKIKVSTFSATKKIFHPKLWVALLCGIILLSGTFATVGATSTIPNNRARIYASLYGNPDQLVPERDAAIWLCGQIDSAFEASGYSSINQCGTDTTRYIVTTNAWNDEQSSLDRIAVFHLGHQSSPNWAYQDNIGTEISWADIAVSTVSKHDFVFMFVCDQARSPSYGIPAAWVHRGDMSSDGYLYPDLQGSCYIGFFGYSPIISGFHQTFEEQMTDPVKYLVKDFYDHALRDSYSVRDALNRACLDFFQTSFTSCVLNQNIGYNCWWPGGDFPVPLNAAGWFPDSFRWHPDYTNLPKNHMKLFGDGSMWVFQPTITLTTNCGASPTFYLDGVARSVGNVNVWAPKTYTISVSDVPGYTFSHFTYDGMVLSRPTTIQLLHSGALTAHYIPQPYINILSSTGGYTTPSAGYYTGSGTMQITATAYGGYHFSYWLLNGGYLSSDQTIYVDYGANTVQPVFASDNPTINVHAVDTYFNEGQPLTANVFVDGTWRGYTYETITVGEGYHNIEVDAWVNDPVFGSIPFAYWTDASWNIISYDNPLYTYVSTDTTFIAWYSV